MRFSVGWDFAYGFWILVEFALCAVSLLLVGLVLIWVFWFGVVFWWFGFKVFVLGCVGFVIWFRVLVI